MNHGAKLVDAVNFCKTGLMNLSLALTIGPHTVADYQARIIDSDCDLVTTLMTLIKTKTPEEFEKLQAHGSRELGQACVLNQKNVFATGGNGTAKFTANNDKLLVINYLHGQFI